MKHAPDLNINDRVICLHGDVDRGIGAGAVGRINGFGRFSSGHPREASVSFDEEQDGADGGWFWLDDLQLVGGAGG